MNGEELRQRLAAILAADAAGYSRLMAADERVTVAALEAARAIFRRQVELHHGRVIDMAGDSVLAVFETATGAVSAALGIQYELQSSPTRAAGDQRLRFRIGVHLGDIIEKGDGTVYGDGVNIAARLQGLAAPDGITVSDSIRNAVKGKVAAAFENLGKQTVKNITEPVHAYRVASRPGAAASGAAGEPRAAAGGARKTIAGVAAVLALAVVAYGTWQYLHSIPESESVAFKEATGIPLPDRPSIAVLPFNNMSGDAEQQYFSDGLTEDLTTNLSYIPDVMVISHTSTSQYRNKSVDVRQIGKDLGVRYVLEGSVQRSGDRMRITAQLIDATSGDHVWAESWDRPVSDFFALQDEITLGVVQKMEVRLAGQLHARKHRGTTNLKAYELYYKGRKFHVKFTKEGFEEAKKYFLRALELDPNYLPALVNLGWVYRNQAFFGYTEDAEKTWQDGMAIAKEVLKRDPEGGDAYALLAKLHNDKGDTVSSRKYIKMALQRDPNSVVFLGLAGLIFNDAGFPEEGLVVTEKAFRLSPFPLGWFYMPLSASYNHMARYEEAIPPARECVKRLPENIECRFHLTIALAGAGKLEEAKRHAKEMLRIDPHSSFMTLHLKTQGSPEVKARLEALLRKVGLLK
jgi:adenylate cyclase